MQGVNLNKDNVVTLVCRPEQFQLNDTEVSFVVGALEQHGGIITDVKWLAPDSACDIFFAVLERLDAREMLNHLLANVAVDFVVQPAGGRRKKLLISDMDSTMIEQECIDEIADMLGIKPEIAAITDRAMNGELDFAEALKERVARLKGVTLAQLNEIMASRITPMPGAKTLVQTMKKHGAHCVLVSGGFTHFTAHVRDLLGFDMDEANQLILQNDALTGEVKTPILDKNSKRDALSFYTERHKLHPHETLALGDGANDLPMLLAAGLGVAYHAKPNVRSMAKAKIDHCDLRALLYVQGYSTGEFVE